MENEEYRLDDDYLYTNAKIRVIGVGGGGSNAVNGMIHDKEDQVDYWVFNTDSQALAASPCENKLILGRNVTKGLGAGGMPEKGRDAALDSYNDISAVVKGSDMVFIACGEGGGTGTGAAPIVAKCARENGALVLAIVTRPFNFEGRTRKINSLEGVKRLKENVDAIIVVSNDKLMQNAASLSFTDAFKKSDEILASAVKTVTDLILVHGLINLDFADVKATLTGKGLALIGIGVGSGKDKAEQAAKNATNSPLLEASIRGSKSMIVNVTIGKDTKLGEVDKAISMITKESQVSESDVSIIFGVQTDPNFVDTMQVAIIATDFDKEVIPFSEPDNPTTTRMEEEPQEEENQQEENNQPSEEAQESLLPSYLKNLLDKRKQKTTPVIDSVQEEKTEVVEEEKVVKKDIFNREIDDEEEEAVVMKRPE